MSLKSNTLITAHSRQDIQAICPDVPYAIISINDPDGHPPILMERNLCRGVLVLHFWDIDTAPPGADARITDWMFSQHQARAILDFVEQQDVEHLLIHCHAGISRSAGVAAALGKIYLNDDTFIFDSARYHPNRLVYRTILNTYFDRCSSTSLSYRL